MKVLQVNNYHFYRGGSERYFLDITQLLREETHDVRTFSAVHPGNINEDWMSAPAVKGVDTERAKGIGNIVSYLFSVEARKQMQLVLKDFKPDIVHLHIYYGQITASIIKPIKDAGIPIVQTLHEYKLVCPTHGLFANGKFCDACQGNSYWRAVQKRCNRGSFSRSALSMAEAYISDWLGVRSEVDHFIAVSDFQRNQLVRLGVNEGKISVLHHFARPVLNPPQTVGDYFLYVGRINRDKGIGVLLEAYSRLNGDVPLLKIAGTGVELAYWQSVAKDLGVGSRVCWLGLKTGSDLKNLYRDCLVVVNPSLLNETFGLTCIEALSAGKPVIASNVGAFPEVVSNGVDGVLFKSGDEGELASALEMFMGVDVNPVQMGLRGWAKVKEQFSADVHLEGIENIYGLVCE